MKDVGGSRIVDLTSVGLRRDADCSFESGHAVGDSHEPPAITMTAAVMERRTLVRPLIVAAFRVTSPTNG
jgi:hypothetical protein